MYTFYVVLPYVISFLPMYYIGAGILHLPKEKRMYRRDEVGRAIAKSLFSPNSFSIPRIHFIMKGTKAFPLSAAKHPKGAERKVAHSAG
jgi:hypothetical protein